MSQVEQVGNSHSYYFLHREKILKRQNAYYKKTRQERLIYMRQYYKERYKNKISILRKINPEKYKEKDKKNWQKRRIRALLKISSVLKCVRCGCDDVRFLEINHKNGGGNKEVKISKIKCNTKRILQGRETNDLELLCRPCNAIHYLEKKYNIIIKNYLVWQRSEIL